MVTELPKTINISNFDKAFVEVSSSLSVGEFALGSNVRFFHLNLRNNEFIREDLSAYLRNNLSRYFHSRTERMDMGESLDSACMKANEAILSLLENNMILPSRELGAMLIYAFLEAKENAPKIMSCVEIERGSFPTNKSKTDGIHLSSDGMVLFATSRIACDLYSAVDEAITKLGQIKENTDEEIKIIKADMKNLLNGVDLETLESVLFPHEGKSASYATGYGVFIGYNIGLEKSKNTERNYLEIVESKMRDGIIDCSSRILEGLKQQGFTGREKIYFYFLPFDNVDDDVDFVFNRVIGR